MRGKPRGQAGALAKRLSQGDAGLRGETGVRVRAHMCVFSEACLLPGINTFHAAGILCLRVNSPFTELTDVIIPQRDSGSWREGLRNAVLVIWDG